MMALIVGLSGNIAATLSRNLERAVRLQGMTGSQTIESLDAIERKGQLSAVG